MTTTPTVTAHEIPLESLARVAEGVAAETGQGGAVEAHPVVTPAAPAPAPAPAPAAPAAPAPAAPAAPAVNVNVTPAKP